MKIVLWILGAAIAMATISFSISNRTPVSIDIWPLPFELTVDLYAIVLITILGGFVAGSMVAWLAGLKFRRIVRRQKSEIRSLNKEINVLRECKNAIRKPSAKAA